ncbi:MAG: DUF1501 domain-containing protein [Armatimonadota bacterium]|nr:DUF1501 domain-containing protein [bacterium]MDW8320569.1 DUF1501 domain-containing protein [Armatimonadota bacterium]
MEDRDDKEYSPARRQVLLGGVGAALGWFLCGGSALAQLAFKPHNVEQKGDVLVCLFLRGGADGLNMVVPYAEDAYYRNRPSLAIPAPNNRRRSANERAVALNDLFALHPALKPLFPLYASEKLLIVHACGSAERSRSHFEAMSAMERGVADAKTSINSGWIARHLLSAPRKGSSPLRAVALSNILPESLRGSTDAVVLQTLSDFRIEVPKSTGVARPDDLERILREMYTGADKHSVNQTAQDTLQVLQTLRRVDPSRYRPANGAVYPDSDLARGLKQVAALIKAQVGLEVACLDRGGWDTHVAQGSTAGWMAANLTDLAQSLAAFATDMGDGMRYITLIVMTEFGRRVRENSGLGTDHGRAGVMLLLSGSIKGGRVYARWHGLEPHQLEEPGDLRVTTDYREVLAEVVCKRLGNPHVAGVFPGITVRGTGIVG